MVKNNISYRFAAIILSVAILFGLTGCAGTGGNSDNKSAEKISNESADVKEDFAKDSETSEDSSQNDVLEENLSDGSNKLSFEQMFSESFGENIDLSDLTLPADSSIFSADCAKKALVLCTGHKEERQAKLLTDAGFTVLLQKNYDKDPSDFSYTSAYTLAKKNIVRGGTERDLFIVTIRGTSGGEWYSNFDFAPSRTEDTSFAENFLFTAEDIFLGIQPELAASAAPLVLVCGHSRGGAGANLLGLLLNSALGAENVYVYTFAAPATVKGDGVTENCKNIFNIINASDPVPALPLEQWGYSRLGTDILLGENGAKTDAADEFSDILFNISPTPSSYYNDRHSLTEEGLSDDGMTSFELMLTLSRYLIKEVNDSRENENSFSADADLASLKTYCKNSDFAPFFDLLSSLAENDGEKASAVLREHMPSVYSELISGMETEE